MCVHIFTHVCVRHHSSLIRCPNRWQSTRATAATAAPSLRPTGTGTDTHLNTATSATSRKDWILVLSMVVVVFLICCVLLLLLLLREKQLNARLHRQMSTALSPSASSAAATMNAKGTSTAGYNKIDVEMTPSGAQDEEVGIEQSQQHGFKYNQHQSRRSVSQRGGSPYAGYPSPQHTQQQEQIRINGDEDDHNDEEANENSYVEVIFNSSELGAEDIRNPLLAPSSSSSSSSVVRST